MLTSFRRMIVHRVAPDNFMTITYFKRYRMEIDLKEPLFEAPPLPNGYQLLPWRRHLLSAHARAKYLSFKDELDSSVFPCLANQEGCHQLMQEISSRSNFVPEGTWLIMYQESPNARLVPCGTVQGIQEPATVGSIQNLGVVPAHRGHGLGTVLLRMALLGFREAGLASSTLEVTAKNVGAHRLYRRVGYRIQRIVYKSIDLVLS